MNGMGKAVGKARRARGPLRIARAARPLTDRWQQVPVEPRGQARLGISFRPLQAQALGLDPMPTLATLLDYPFQLIRLGAYWNRIEDGPGRFDTSELDRQVEAAEQAGKQIIVCVGPVKTFGYPEFFVPGHQLPEPLREGALVEPADHQPLLTRRRRSPLGWCGDTAIARRSSRGRSSTMPSTRSAWNIPGACPPPSCGARSRPSARPTRPGRC